ncbi:DUF5009 domain-containing protein [Shewanella maritima]|uniref:DUF5009 domain-containing protein n=1 Tax=Shewanella maritima TaxID=2520507 RepID=A0A411PDV8_9GAMM|nr:DUF5009 domain-containing protein [Shewanella maritima]QBF81787.1 DUF5009 domain-containing protein [Shewanella maritima]
MSTASKPRLQSLDALRGFDMLWILGAEGLFAALIVLFAGINLPTSWLSWADGQMHHSVWHGITFYDVIFPLFIFLSGVALGLSGKRIDHLTFAERKPKYLHALKRLGLLLLLGVIYNHGWGTGIPADPEQVRYASVLGRIAFAWFFAAMLIWHTSLTTQIVSTGVILVGYALLLLVVPYPAGEAGVLSESVSINAYIDSLLLPGISYQNLAVDPEGVLSTIPAIANALIGSFVGRYIVKPHAKGEWAKVATMFMAGIAFIAAAQIFSTVLPINKTLWTSTFVLATCGWSLLLLAVFYAVIDVLQYKRWAHVFTIVGCNAIVIYVASSLMNWQYLASSVFGGVINGAPDLIQPLLSVIALLFVQCALLHWLYKRKIFISI